MPPMPSTRAHTMRTLSAGLTIRTSLWQYFLVLPWWTTLMRPTAIYRPTQ